MFFAKVSLIIYKFSSLFYVRIVSYVYTYLRATSVITHVASVYANLLEQKKAFA